MATSDNYLSKFKPNSCFFTDPVALSQSSAQAFGPVSGDLTNKFRLTTKFSMTSTKAFAICSGIVLVQPQTGSTTKVNLILRPFVQPIQGLNIKYFVYRGLTKSNFFTGNNVIAATGTTSDFINGINASFTSYYTKIGQTKPVFLAKYIGFDPTNQPDSLMLADFFFKDSEYVESGGQFVEDTSNAYELPLVQKGASLGNFAAGTCGIDVVLNYGDYKLPLPNDEFLFDLAYARAVEAIIDVTAATAYQKKLKREQIFQFIDAAAYFGFHANEGGTLDVIAGAVKVKKQGVEIYTDVVTRFSTKNRLYLYIQSDRTRSYNFYGNYALSTGSTSSLKMGITSATLANRVYAVNEWPIIIDATTQTHNETSNKIYLQFATDNNVNSMLYGQVGSIDNAQKNNFCGADDLRLPDDVNGVPSTLTKKVIISNPNAGVSGAKSNIASFNILIYQGKLLDYFVGQQPNPNGDLIDVFSQPNFFDDVFDNLTAEPLLKTAAPSDYSIISSQKIKLINRYYEKAQKGLSAIQTTIVNDVIATEDTATPVLNRITYVTEPVEVLTNATSTTRGLATSTQSAPSTSNKVIELTTYQLPDSYFYQLQLFTDLGQTVFGLRLKTFDGSFPDKILLGITNEENDLLTGMISSNLLNNPRLFLLDLFDDGNQLVSAENISYQKFKAGIVGELVNGDLKLFMPDIDIMIYSLDRNYHFSINYSRYMKDYEYSKPIIDLETSL